MIRRATAHRREQGRRTRLPRVRDHGVPLHRIAVLHGPHPPPAAKSATATSRSARHHRSTSASSTFGGSAHRGRGICCGLDRLLDVGVGVRQAREERLVAARREVHAPIEQSVEELRVARVVGRSRAVVVVHRIRREEQRRRACTRAVTCAATPASANASRRPAARRSAVASSADVAVVVEECERGEPGGGRQRVPRQRARLVHGAERRELVHDGGRARRPPRAGARRRRPCRRSRGRA